MIHPLIKILVLEDNPNDADLLDRELKKSGLNFTSIFVRNKLEYEEALENFTPDIILSDYSLPSFDAATAFQIKQEKDPNIPFIIVSGIIGEENAVTLIKEGVTDYASKNKLFTLVQKIRRALKESEERQKIIINAEKLKQQSIELLHANKELLAFTYIASHDLQEPLRKIQIFAGKVIEEEQNNLSETGKDMLTRMKAACERMQKLIQDLLAFSRLSYTAEEFTTMDLNNIVEDVKNELIEDIKSKAAIIDSTELGSAHIIPFQFRQLMQNLLSNSLKFSKPDIAPNIKIKSSKIKFKKGDNIKIQPNIEYEHITVTDNGIGFEGEYSEKIFEVFQRLHSKEVFAGTGIGLSIVKKIVENHNGFITASSELGKGMSVDIYIPVL